MPGNSLADVQKLARHHFSVAGSVKTPDELMEIVEKAVQTEVEEPKKPKKAKKSEDE